MTAPQSARPLLAALALLLAAACGGASSPSTPATGPAGTPPQATVVTPSTDSGQAPVARIGTHVFRLEIADTPEKRAKGLSGRASLPQDVAMLFVFDLESPWAFWMKDTLIPLDIVWLDAASRIVDIQTMQPQTGSPDGQLTIYQPRAAALYALEMNAGLAAAYGFAPGMQVELELR